MWFGATTTKPCVARCSVRVADCSRMPPKPWLNATSGKGPCSTSGSALRYAFSVIGTSSYGSGVAPSPTRAGYQTSIRSGLPRGSVMSSMMTPAL